MSRIAVYVVDDHPLFRQGIRLMLAPEEQVEIVGEASSGVQAIQDLEYMAVDVVLMNISLPDVDSVQVVRQLKQKQPGVNIVLLAPTLGEYITSAMKAGAVGCLLKSADRQELIRGIQAASRGLALIDPVLTQQSLSTLATWPHLGVGQIHRN